MATTNRFGLEAFGPEGTLSDNGHKFTLRDRQTIDALFWTLFNHDHRETQTAEALLGPSGRPILTLATSGGFLGASQDLHYRISFMDSQGNETEASISSFVRTAAPLAPPEQPFLTPSLTGGSLDDAGIYRYALAFFQTGGKTTRAPNTSSITLGTTATGSITVELPALPSGADGWHVYRRDPLSDDYYYLTEVTGAVTEFLDDGSFNPDCTRKRPSNNTTNNANTVTVAIDPNDIPLDTRVTAWRIYRSFNGIFGSASLLTTITDTTTVGGTDLVTSYIDVGVATVTGTPLEQAAIPPSIPGLDVEEAFSGSAEGSYLPSAFAPQGVSQFHAFLSGALTNGTRYSQTEPLYDMRVHRADVFALTAPTGADGTNHAIVRVKDDGTANTIQSVYTDAAPVNEVQRLHTDATSGTFTLTYNAQTTAAIDFDATALELQTALEALSNITSVLTEGTGIATDPWIIRFLDPVVAPTPLSQDGSLLVGGTLTFVVVTTGSGGGTFTLGLDGQVTAAIAFDAAAGAVATALEALSNVVDVTVTGTGTQADPWLVEFIDPGGVEVPLLYADATNLTGSAFIEQTQAGYGSTTVDIPLSGTGQFFEFVPGSITAVDIEAEDATHDGTEMSDEIALNDVAVALVLPGESVKWNPGMLTAGTYRFRAYVASPIANTELLVKVSDLGAGGTLSGDMEEVLFVVNRASYTPTFDVVFVSTGTENIELATEMGTGDSLRVDRLTYEPSLPTFHAGATLSVEVVVVGAPTTPGSNVQLNLWY